MNQRWIDFFGNVHRWQIRRNVLNAYHSCNILWITQPRLRPAEVYFLQSNLGRSQIFFWTNLRPQKYTQVVLKCYDKCFQKQHRHNLCNGNTIQTSRCNCQMRYFLYKFRSTDSAITNFEKGLGIVKIRRRFKINQVQCDFRFKNIQ